MSSTDASADPADSAATESADAQGLLFDGDFSPLPIDLGFRGPVACSAAGITYRQLDYWARTGLVVPEVRERVRLRLPAPLQLPRHLDPQGDQAADRCRHLAAADPHRDRASAGPRRRTT